jgi:hypothetical protein
MVLRCLQMVGLTCWGSGGRGFGRGESAVEPSSENAQVRGRKGLKRRASVR